MIANKFIPIVYISFQVTCVMVSLILVCIQVIYWTTGILHVYSAR